MKNGFGKKWDAMTVSERIDHLLADWKTVSDTSDPLVLRVAAAVAHHVLNQAQAEIEQLRLSGEERVANLRSYDAELREQVAQTRRERDAVRRWLCNILANPEMVCDLAKPLDPRDVAKEQGWDCFKEER
jgi:hypothetical protein